MFDTREPGKSQRAKEAVLGLGDRVVLSTQVLQEFYWATTRKAILDIHKAREAVDSLSEFDVVTLTPRIVSDAIDISIVQQLSIWDSLIIQAAIAGRCERLLTEDLNHGQRIKGILVENPFRSA
jgi:predicted nucleic acid-binding protein